MMPGHTAHSTRSLNDPAAEIREACREETAKRTVFVNEQHVRSRQLPVAYPFPPAILRGDVHGLKRQHASFFRHASASAERVQGQQTRLQDAGHYP